MILSFDSYFHHFSLRAQYGIPPLTYDANVLMPFAQQRAERLTQICRLSHDGAAPYGENLAMITGYAPDWNTLNRLIDMWINEDINGYNHLTQMLWSGSMRVGCGVSFGCEGTYLACNLSAF
ncbi:hypothetical protein HMI56_003754 [Coelomomyces lativittatus]|nr:hypothetical protein HMI56_003754 [Coelomomyces lativittatus]